MNRVKVEMHQFIDDNGTAWGEFATYCTMRGWFWSASDNPSGPFKSRKEAIDDAQANGRFVE